jgi:hypothetical protein
MRALLMHPLMIFYGAMMAVVVLIWAFDSVPI